MVSIIVTAHNVEKYITHCLQSAVNQDFANKEIIVVDDGSTDHTGKLVQEYVSQYEYISYYYQENSGVSVARNKGMELSNGEYIVFLDGDDALEKDCLSILMKAVDDNTDIVIGDYYSFDENNNKQEGYFFRVIREFDNLQEKEILFLQLMNGNYGKPAGNNATAVGVPWGKLYRKSFLKSNKITFNPRLIRMQDNNFNMYAFYYSRKIIYLHKPVYDYRIEHIKGFKMPAAPQLWRLLIEDRDEFYLKHPQIVTPQIKNESLYEKYVGISSSCLYYAKNCKTVDAIKQYKNLCLDKVYHASIYEGNNVDLPNKFKLIHVLLSHNCFGLTYFIFILYAKFLEAKSSNKRYRI